MLQLSTIYKGRYTCYYINDSTYKIDIYGLEDTVECTKETTPFKDVDLETACLQHIDMLCDKLDEEDREQRLKEEELNRPISQDEIQAEILLNQADILANQNAQDEVLAEVLLNSLEVSTNV